MRSSVHLLATVSGLLAAATLGFAAARPAAGQSYTLTDLGSLPAYNRYWGDAINATGQAAVSSAIESPTGLSTPGHALLYNGAGLVDLGVFKPAGANQASAAAINNGGWVVGTATSGSKLVTALWRNGQIVQVAPNVAVPEYGINNAASPQITGSYHPRPGQGCAFLWQNGTLTNLPFGEGHAINDSGKIAGRNNDNACVWTKSGGLVNLPTLVSGAVTDALAINNSGIVTGHSHDSLGRYHAVYWDAAGAIHDMGLLGGAETKAYGINGLGTIVGQFFGSPGGAFRWDPLGGYVDLNSLIEHAAYPGWFISAANGINDNGQIVGIGYVNGDNHEHAFILTPIP
jgi:probable HAF family extracellular repeat protein